MQFNIKSGEYYMSNDSDPIYDYISKIMIVENDKREFAGRLVAVLGNELWFEGRNGRRWMQNRNEIKTMRLGRQV
jgi:hypothetical protein